MTIKVLVVDDSAFFRRRVTEILNSHPELEVVGDAPDGKVAIEQVAKLRPDVVTMDIEMPVMDGITAVKNIMANTPTAIIMFSSLTHEGATATLEALEAGAVDFLPKRFEDIAKDKKEGTKLLQDRVRALGAKSSLYRRRPTKPVRPTTSPVESRNLNRNKIVNTSERPTTGRTNLSVEGRISARRGAPVRAGQSAIRQSSGKRYGLLAIGTSTGGPVALQKVLTNLPNRFSVPIIIVQHMPAAFTPAFASRLNSLCDVQVKEAANGEPLRAGVAYLAPGGKQMLIEGRAGQAVIKVMDDDSERVTYKPSVDLSFGSAAKVYGGDVLAIILTGMGVDGREGCRMLKQRGAKVWAQDEQSCVVYGMPQAVTASGISEKSIALDDMGPSILKEFNLN